MPGKIDKTKQFEELTLATKKSIFQKRPKLNHAQEDAAIRSASATLKILHLEDLESDAKLVRRQLKKANIEYEGLLVDNKVDYITALRDFSPDIILADHTLPSFNSLEALKILKETGKKIPFVLITATVSEEYAAKVMREGADDYILKDRPQRLPAAMLSVLEKYKIENEREKFYKKVVASEAMLALKNKQLVNYNQIVSHDLRSPIMNIMLIADIIDKVTDAEDRKRLFAGLKNIASNMNEILNVLVDIAKIDAEGFNGELILFEEAFDKEINVIDVIARQLNATFTTDFTECPVIFYSKLNLESLFLNLMSNSMKYYSPERSPVISIRSYRHEKKTILEYRDNGLGIDLKKFGKNLFGLNQTVHENKDRKGLGLFMIKSQLESRGGRIRAESKKNEGIKFIIEFAT